MKVSRDVFKYMTDAQLHALSVMLGNWQQIDDDKIEMWLEFGTTVMVDMAGKILIGVEPDGYTHS